MIENVTRFTSKIGEEVSHWIVKNDTNFDIAEKMLLQFIQQLGALKQNQIQNQQTAAKEAALNQETEKDQHTEGNQIKD